MSTVIYLVRHAETISENGIRNTNETNQMINEKKLGNLDEIAVFMKNKKTTDPSQEQLLYPKFKTSDGESAEDTNKRMTDFLNEVLKKYKEKRVVIVSHGGSIKFLSLNWCKVNENIELEYKNKKLFITSPCLIKLTFNNKELIDIEQIV